MKKKFAKIILCAMTCGTLLGASVSAEEYEAGQYKVGVDIDAGEYVLFADTDSGYFGLSNDANGDDMIESESFEYNIIVTIDEGAFFELKRCRAIPFDEAGKIDLSGCGMFKVGYHMPAGEYKLIAEDGKSGYYCIYDDSTFTDYVTSNSFEGSRYMEVKDGQYILLKRCHFETAPENLIQSEKKTPNEQVAEPTAEPTPEATATPEPTATPIPEPEFDADVIRDIQEKLNLVGYNCGEPDGVIGEKTKDQIIFFQQDKGLKTDGEITEEFIRVLNEEVEWKNSDDYTSDVLTVEILQKRLLKKFELKNPIVTESIDSDGIKAFSVIADYYGTYSFACDENEDGGIETIAVLPTSVHGDQANNFMTFIAKTICAIDSDIDEYSAYGIVGDCSKDAVTSIIFRKYY